MNVASGLYFKCQLGFRFVLQNLTAAVKTVGADVVTQMCFASCWLDSDTWHVQRIVRTVHATFRR